MLAKDFDVSQSAFDRIPKGERFMFQTERPPALEGDVVADPQGRTEMKFSLAVLSPKESPGGRVRIADSSNFKVAENLASALVEVDPGHIRELHWHPNADEWQYYISGQARMTVFAAEGNARTFDYQAGDVGYVPVSMPHYVENGAGAVARPRAVPRTTVRGRLALVVDGADAARACAGDAQYRRRRAGQAAQGQAAVGLTANRPADTGAQ